MFLDQGFASPYYGPNHAAFRDRVRKFVDTEITPYANEWIKKGQTYPKDLHMKAYEAGIGGILFPAEYGGTKPKDFDAFYEIILWDELFRSASGSTLGQLAINSMALPPIIQYGSKKIKDLVLKDVIQGKKFCSLMISEPTAGSDVASIKTTAERIGDFYKVNGLKKWITGGHMADFFTTAVRTGSEGGKGLSLLLIPRNLAGISVRKMETMFGTLIIED